MKATELLDNFMKFYGSSALAQDLVETGTGAVIGATGQVLFTDMSPEEIALSTALGAGAAMGIRPIAASAGRFVGKSLPASWNESLVKLQKDMGVNLPIPTKEYLDALDNEIIELKHMGLNKQAGLMEGIKPALEAKYNAEFKDRTALEGLLGYGSRLYGDNLAQLGVAATMPYILGDQESSNTQPQDI
jgi:hypothetical protein